ncbi:MAG: L,D-transpeptidase family protein [Gemmatirosa sp.]|nr:L,D-transpeptidase family protein [Gemmatirosa sp.]
MTMFLLARPVLSAILPLLAAAGDSTPLPRPTSPAAPAVPAPTTVAAPALPAPPALALLALAPMPAPAPTAAPVVSADGRVAMPTWAIGTRTGLAHAGRADSIVVEKAQHRMTLYAGSQALGTFLVAIGKQSTGAKERAGDYRTPEGLYQIDARNPNSRYHLALHVSYPNATDLAHARALGVSPGGDVMIHGLPNGQGNVGAAHREYDWTNGCVAVTDQEIEQIWGAVPVGTPIRIRP